LFSAVIVYPPSLLGNVRVSDRATGAATSVKSPKAMVMAMRLRGDFMDKDDYVQDR